MLMSLTVIYQPLKYSTSKRHTLQGQLHWQPRWQPLLSVWKPAGQEEKKQSTMGHGGPQATKQSSALAKLFAFGSQPPHRNKAQFPDLEI